jgi:hypothetical protein
LHTTLFIAVAAGLPSAARSSIVVQVMVHLPAAQAAFSPG